jgi:hypothetical protein
MSNTSDFLDILNLSGCQTFLFVISLIIDTDYLKFDSLNFCRMSGFKKFS